MNEKFVYPTIKEIDEEILRVQRKRKVTIWRTAFIIMLVTAFFATTMISMKYVSFLMVSGNSMEPVLRSGDVVIYRKFGNVDRGDVVVIERDGVLMIKRVVALAGDEISVSADGRVTLNGVLLDEAYITRYSFGNNDIEYPAIVPAESFFVMGDNRRVSLDSRNSAVGLIDKEEIRGNILAVIWPFFRISSVN